MFLLSNAPAAVPDSSTIHRGMQHGHVSRVRLLHIAYGKFLSLVPFVCLSDVMGSVFFK